MKVDTWMEDALIDDTLVVNALLAPKKSPPPVLQWGRRKSRYIPAPVMCLSSVKPRRFSPTTPLSWTGDNSSATRSKGAFANESLKSASNKRSGKKRTFDEFKEQENLLLKESPHLQRDLAPARTTVKEKEAVSKKLKRLKFNLPLESIYEIGETSTQSRKGIPNPMELCPMGDAHSNLPKQNICSDVAPKSDCSDAPKNINACSDLATKSSFSDAPKDIGRRAFVLPDLNLDLLEDDGTIPQTMYKI